MGVLAAAMGEKSVDNLVNMVVGLSVSGTDKKYEEYQILNSPEYQCGHIRDQVFHSQENIRDQVFHGQDNIRDQVFHSQENIRDQVFLTRWEGLACLQNR